MYDVVPIYFFYHIASSVAYGTGVFPSNTGFTYIYAAGVSGKIMVVGQALATAATITPYYYDTTTHTYDYGGS